MKNKYVRKMLSFMLAVTMTCTACVPAYADEIDAGQEDVAVEDILAEDIEYDSSDEEIVENEEDDEQEASMDEDADAGAADASEGALDGLIEDADTDEVLNSSYADKAENRFESYEEDGDDAEPPAIPSWPEGLNPSLPEGKALYGTDTMYFKWCENDDVPYTADDDIDWATLEANILKPYDVTNPNGGYPKEEGAYFAVAYIDETAEYEGLRSDLISFSVTQRVPIDISQYDAKSKVIVDEEDGEESTVYYNGYVILTVNGKRIWSDDMADEEDEEGNKYLTTLDDENYTGAEITKGIVLEDVASSFEPAEMIEGEDYKVEYSENVNVGTATVTITGISDTVTGFIVKTFKINKVAPTISVNPVQGTGKFPATIEYEIASNSDGEFSAESSDEDIATVSLEGNKVILTPVDTGNVTVTIRQEEGTNWTASDDVKVTAVIENGDMVVTPPEDHERKFTGMPIVPEEVVVQTPEDAVVTYGVSADACTEEDPPSFTDVGKYKVFYKVSRKGYNDITGSYSMEISRVENYWEKEPYVRDWCYGAMPSRPTCKPAFGKAEYTYSRSETGPFTELPAVPEVGKWYMKAHVDGNSNYDVLEGVVPFEITTHPYGHDIMIAVDTRSVVYTGKEITKEVIIKTGVTTLTEGRDYAIEYKNNIDVGKASFKITFKGNYNGETERSFYITKKPQAAPEETNWLPSNRTETTPSSVAFTGIKQNENGTTVEYALKGWKHPWQAEPKFNGLPEGRTFTVLARYAGDANHQMSAETAIGTISTELSSWRDFFFVTGKIKNKNRIMLTWMDVKGANRYDIYGSAAGAVPVRLATVNGTVHTYKTAGLAKNNYYRYYVEARYDGNGKSQLLVKTPEIYVSLKKKVGNATRINSKKSIRVKAGKKKDLKLKLKSSKKKTTKKVSKFRYHIVDPTICSVSAKGKVKGLKAGKTQVWIYANNGIRRKVTVTVY